MPKNPERIRLYSQLHKTSTIYRFAKETSIRITPEGDIKGVLPAHVSEIREFDLLRPTPQPYQINPGSFELVDPSTLAGITFHGLRGYTISSTGKKTELHQIGGENRIIQLEPDKAILVAHPLSNDLQKLHSQDINIYGMLCLKKLIAPKDAKIPSGKHFLWIESFSAETVIHFRHNQ